MKKALFFTLAGAIAIGGIAYATLHNWSGGSLQKTQEVEHYTSVLNQPNESLSGAQNQQTSLPYAIAFYNGDKTFRVDLLQNGFSQPKLVTTESDAVVIEMEKYFTTSLMPKSVYNALPISENMIFLTGLQSNLDPNLWFYSERVDEGQDYNVRSYNVSTKEKKVLFGRKNSPNKNYAFKPFAISNDNSVVYLEAFLFDSYLNNEEIWEMNLSTKAFRKLNVHRYYNGTPAMSPDGKYLLYQAGSEPNNVHVSPNQLYLYDLETNKEVKIFSDEKGYVGMKGWIKTK